MLVQHLITVSKLIIYSYHALSDLEILEVN
jgi:hypothetical protein